MADRDDLQDRRKPSIQLDKEQAIAVRKPDASVDYPAQHNNLVSERSISRDNFRWTLVQLDYEPCAGRYSTHGRRSTKQVGRWTKLLQQSRRPLMTQSGARSARYQTCVCRRLKPISRTRRYS